MPIPFLIRPLADHIMGIPTLLRNLLRPPRVDALPPPSNAIAHRKMVHRTSLGRHRNNLIC